MLNKILKKVIDQKKESMNKRVDIRSFYLVLSLGIRVTLIYMLFIILIGKHFANLIGCDNLYLLSFILATLANIYIVIDVFRKFFKSLKNK